MHTYTISTYIDSSEKLQFWLGRTSLKVPKESKSEKMICFTYIGCRSTPPGFPPGPNPSPLLQVKYFSGILDLTQIIRLPISGSPWPSRDRDKDLLGAETGLNPPDPGLRTLRLPLLGLKIKLLVTLNISNMCSFEQCSSNHYISATQTTRPSTRPL